jgi:hypothetical protein
VNGSPRRRSSGPRRPASAGRLAAVVLVAALLGGLAPAAALAEQARDPDDVAGKLDYKKLTATKRRRKDSAIVTMVFHDGFRPQALKKPNALVLWIDVNVDDDADFKGTVHDGRGGILIHLDELGGSHSLNPLPVFRLAKDTYRVVLPSGQPYDTPGKKAFFATSKFCSTMCSRDRVPDAGWVGSG